MKLSKTHSLVLTAVLFISGWLLLCSSASAVHLGITAVPPGTVAGCDPGFVHLQYSSSPGRSYTVPAGGGQIASWSTITTPTDVPGTLADTPGSDMSLVVVNPGADGALYSNTRSIRAVNTQTIPTPLPADGTATFVLPEPLTVQAGDMLGTASTNSMNSCYFASISPSNPYLNQENVAFFSHVSAVSPGNELLLADGNAVATDTVNLSVELVQNMDVQVKATVIPDTIEVGGASVINFAVKNNGDSVQPIKLHQTVPAGLKVLAASSDLGGCTVDKQNIDCDIQNLAMGATATVQVIVSASKAGAYDVRAQSSSAFVDKDTSNNNAVAHIHVRKQGAAGSSSSKAACRTVSLRNRSLSFAKNVIRTLNCQVGKTSKRYSVQVKKGRVIATRPGAGKTLPRNTPIAIIVSQGKQ